MENTQGDGRYSSASTSAIDISIKTIVDHLSELDSSTSPKSQTPSNVIMVDRDSDGRRKMLQTLQKAINYAPLLQAARSNIQDKPSSLQKYMDHWMAAGSPRLTINHVHLENQPRDIFCVLLHYRDIDLPSSLPPLPPASDPLAYRIRNIRGFGKSVVATRRISAGEIIMTDRPVLITPMAATYLDRDELEDLLDSSIQVLRQKEREMLENLCDSLPESMGGRWRRIRLCNAVSITFPGSKQLPHYGAVFPVFSRCNHSCGPNASAHFDPSTLTLELRAVRDIMKGDQITIGYCDLLEGHKDRQKWLLSKYEFTCECTYCTQSATDVASDRRRDRIRTASEGFCEKIWWTLELDRVIKILKDLLEAVELEGLQEYRHGYLRWLVRVYASLGDARNTKFWATEASRSPRIQIDTENTIKERHLWQMVLTDVTRHPDWNSRKVDPLSAPSSAPRTYNDRGAFTELQALALKRAEVAYQRAGEPTMGRVVPYRDYHFCIWVIFEDLSTKYATDHVYGQATPTPTPPPFRIGTVPGMGKGLIADKRFGHGELIVSERPIVLYPADFFNVNFPAPTFSQADFADLLDSLVPMLDQREYAKLMDLPDPGKRMGRNVSGSKLYRIVTANSQLVRFPQTEFLQRYCGVFATLARCNHSCIPNAAIAFDATSLVMELRAIRPIKKGEEITYAYDNILLPCEARQRLYKELYGFDCQCQQCTTHSDDTESDERRIKISPLVTDQIASLTVSHGEKLRRYEEILRAIDEENLGLYRFRCIGKLAETCAFMGDVRNAMRWHQEGMRAKYIAPVDGVEDFQKRNFFSSAIERLTGQSSFNG